MDNNIPPTPPPAPRPMRPAAPPPPKFAAGIVIAVVAVLIAAVALFQTVFMLNSGHEAVITRFGAYTNTISAPGLQFKIPFVDRADLVDVESIRRLEFGYRTDAYGNTSDFNDEASMLTGDENLVVADWAILYRVVNSYNYLFKVNNPENTLRVISESSYRRVVASHPLDDILTDQKDAIQIEVMNDLQLKCDAYELGVRITAVQLQDAMPPDEVKDSFLDVSSAKEEKSAKINEASQYENEKLPQARGEAAKLINDAEAYKARRINEAEGAVARYKSIQLEYQNNKDIMKTRMYLEMISEVFPKLERVYIVDENGNTLNFLPLSGGNQS